MFLFDYFIMLVGVLLSVAFLTLFERKLLGYIHFRKGPTKLLYFGMLQPISDALKLFSKEALKGYKFSYYFFFLGPFTGLILMLTLWAVYGSFWGVFGGCFSILYMFCFLSLGVYFLLFCSWGSNSKYALLGGYRAVSQTVSYEVSMIFFVLFVVYFISSYDSLFCLYFQSGFWVAFTSLVFFSGWLYVCLAESNRTPFDFSEGESELVSGFNVEYGGVLFSFVFICEYGMIIFLCFLSSLFFLGGSFFILKIFSLSFFYIWVRCCFPRYRYDLLMSSAWKVVLPFSLFLLMVGVVIFN